jgi:hypothetical protein
MTSPKGRELERSGRRGKVRSEPSGVLLTQGVEMVGAQGLGNEARQAKRTAQGQGCRRTQACCDPAPHVGRRHRVQLVNEEGCRVARTRRSQGSRNTAGKDVPAGTVAVVRSLDSLRALKRATALSTLIRQRHLTPSCEGQNPTAERTVGPARMIVESLTPRPGIREQNRPNANIEGPAQASYAVFYACPKFGSIPCHWLPTGDASNGCGSRAGRWAESQDYHLLFA